MNSSRRPSFDTFRSERQAAFSSKVREAYLEGGRERKERERARMEAYRRLCAEEGIQSKRLEEYDRACEEASADLKSALEVIDRDESLTNNEKKRRKYNLKRKSAARTINEIIGKKRGRYTAITGLERSQKKSEENRQIGKQAWEERMRNKAFKGQLRRAQNDILKRRTTRGQPVLSGRVECLLQRITREGQ